MQGAPNSHQMRLGLSLPYLGLSCGGAEVASAHGLVCGRRQAPARLPPSLPPCLTLLIPLIFLFGNKRVSLPGSMLPEAPLQNLWQKKA